MAEMINVKIALRGQAALLKVLNELSLKAKDTSALMARLATLGFRDIMDHFAKESGPDGKWSPLKINRRRIGRYRKLRGARHKILQDKGRLRGSIQPVVESPHRAVIATTGVIYAATHQFGNKKRNIPARPFMWLSRQSKDTMFDVARKYWKTT